jgi:putative aldouronate transport system permease protein
MKSASKGDRAIDIFIYATLILFSLVTIFPFLNVAALSVNEAWDTYKGGLTIYPRVFTLDNYKAVFDTANIQNYYYNSIFRTVLGTLFSLFFNAITAYALSKKYLKIRRPMLAFLVFTTLFGGGLVPYYMQLRNLHLINSIWVYIFPGIYNVFNILIFRTYFEGIPESLEESARIDGANDITIMWHIILPLSMLVIAAIALFTGVGNWNDWYTGEFFVYSNRLHTIQNYLLKVLAQNAGADTIDKYRRAGDAAHAVKISPESIRMAVLMTATLPILCIYPFLQKYFVKGVMIGAVKG